MQSKKQRKEENQTSAVKTKCSTCGREIFGERYFRCTRCAHFNQCLECYSVDSSCHPLDMKKYTRDYHIFLVVDPNPVSILRSDWDSNEELTLLSAIKLLGVGNWNSIAEWMKPRTAVEIEAHYIQTYIESQESPLPINRVLEPAIVPPAPTYNTKPIESHPSEGQEANLAAKNKKEKTTPAEYSGWMPYRHEFELEYINEAEDIVANIDFADNSSQSFEEKIRCLASYNQILKERHFRTGVIEEWDIHHLEQKPPTNKSEKELDPRILNSTTKIEKEIDEKLLPLAPYLGKNDVVEIAENLHKRIKLNALIESRIKWQKCGVRTMYEGQLYNELEKMIKEGKINQTEVDQWNKAIENYIRKHKRDASSPETELLTEKESELCSQLKMHAQMFYAIKDLLLREYAIRGILSRFEAVQLCSDISNQISAVYDLLLSNGWISD